MCQMVGDEVMLLGLGTCTQRDARIFFINRSCEPDNLDAAQSRVPPLLCKTLRGLVCLMADG